MRTFKKSDLYFILIALFIGISSSIAQSTNTISRTLHPVVIKGADLPCLLGKSVNEIRLVRYLVDEDRWEDIPFQIDELDDSEFYNGIKDGLLGENDELVFLSRSFGDSTTTNNWIESGSLSSYSRHLIEGIDPLTGEKGWVYAFHDINFTKAAPDYLQFNETLDRIQTDVYQITHGSSGFQEDMLFRDETGGDDIDIFDRQQFRIRFFLDYSPIGDKTIDIKEEMDENITIDLLVTKIKARIVTQKKSVEYVANGNLRIHRILTLQVDLTSDDLDDVHIEIPFLTTFYPEYSVWQTKKLEIPDFGDLPYGVTAKVKRIRLSTDLNANSIGMQFYNPYNTGGVRIDSRDDSGFDEHLNWPGDNWYLIKPNPSDGESKIFQGSLLSIIRFTTEPLGSDQEIFFKEERKEDKDDTGDLVAFGNSGVRVLGNNIRGELDFYSANYYKAENLSLSEAEGIFNKHIHPVQINSYDEHKTCLLAVQAIPPEGGFVTSDPDTGIVGAEVPVVFLAQASPGYQFAGWDENGINMENPFVSAFVSDTTITAWFNPITDIVFQTEPPSYPVMINGEEYNTPFTLTAIENTTYTIGTDTLIQYSARSRYIFNNWSNGELPEFDLIVPTEDETLTVQYTFQHKLATYVRPAGTGTVLTDPDQTWIDDGTQVIFQAIPEPFYHFDRWAASLSSNENPDTLIMDSYKNVFAVFANDGPVVHAPDTLLAEDDTLKIPFSEINTWAIDNEEPDSSLIFSFTSGDHVKAVTDSAKGLFILTTSLQDWNGLDTLFVTFEDHLGAAGMDTLFVKVEPMPDAPWPFALLDPEHESIFTEWPEQITFSWEPAFDPDEGDIIYYLFELDSTSTFDSGYLIQQDSLLTTEWTIDWPASHNDREYVWRITARDGQGHQRISEDLGFTFELQTPVISKNSGIPETFVLSQNYPNPFNGITTIQYGLPQNSPVSIKVYNNRGQLIQTLMDDVQEAGYHQVQWLGQDRNYQAVASGLYFIVMQSPDQRIVQKAMYLK